MVPRVAAVVVLVGLGAIALAASGCEYVVRLDRSLVDAGGEAGCPICSDTSEDDAGAVSDATIDATSSDAAAGDASAGDAFMHP